MLPTTFENRPIVQRLPFAMAGTIVMGASKTGEQFGSAAFLHNVDDPFEVVRMVPRVVGVDPDEEANLTGAFGDRYLSCRVTDFGLGIELVKASTLIPNLIKSNRFHSWEFGAPHTVKHGAGFTVLLDSAVFVDTEVLWSVRVAFIGSLLTLGGK